MLLYVATGKRLYLPLGVNVHYLATLLLKFFFFSLVVRTQCYAP